MSKDYILPPSFCVTLSQLDKPQVLHVAVQFQALTGLRAGQISMITAQDLKSLTHLWAGPFKHRKVPIWLNIQQVPVWLIQAFMSFSKSDCTPILPYTPEQYKQKFRELTASYGLPHSSHAARHLFASFQRFLNVSLSRIQQGMTHEDVRSLQTYLHLLSKDNAKVILQNPKYF